MLIRETIDLDEAVLGERRLAIHLMKMQATQHGVDECWVGLRIGKLDH